ncbi:MAG TPA: secondary thiamine-phosphate synthase enzyme YjbQ [Flexilinea sp.]|nr:secondary thiamine-phosphate synthase enzyme YjbQ [Flexilinea sp.]HOR56850.1 secondary thiamine-phosphate synthase enzyme YjbQ [Flexilinea sp.]HOU20491.1 secondary thiamine-phosphate synthase enzyme YjbQ [Flexilinea sp.]HQJ01921.1 secondary thiamine-phosphate synthase enzyme YjbQ [Flexilinea sp.]HQN63102.1 secondary thiamine-phosphate synthase enzyme YjbQ [Flexilinea sp.]
MKTVQFTLQTSGRSQLIDITSRVREAVTASGIREGLCTIFIPHTTAAVTINENADPDVVRDFLYELDKIVPWQDGYRHAEGNSAAHLKSSLIGVSEQVLIENGRLMLGTWQGIYFCEFDGPRTRRVLVRIDSSDFSTGNTAAA